jgi:hypothetical protein
MYESLDGRFDIVPDSFSLDVLIHDRLTFCLQAVHNIGGHCILSTSVDGFVGGLNGGTDWLFLCDHNAHSPDL